MDVREMARMGGIARNKALTVEERRRIAVKASRAAVRARAKKSKAERQELARKAAQARWGGKKES
ncbi:MAG: hypothetical protein JO356_08695 [Acidobacteria bacterium]|nr:hypothetical protein [Acidobacteriota bacterium]